MIQKTIIIVRVKTTIKYIYTTNNSSNALTHATEAKRIERRQPFTHAKTRTVCHTVKPILPRGCGGEENNNKNKKQKKEGGREAGRSTTTVLIKTKTKEVGGAGIETNQLHVI